MRRLVTCLWFKSAPQRIIQHKYEHQWYIITTRRILMFARPSPGGNQPHPQFMTLTGRQGDLCKKFFGFRKKTSW